MNMTKISFSLLRQADTACSLTCIKHAAAKRTYLLPRLTTPHA